MGHARKYCNCVIILFETLSKKGLSLMIEKLNPGAIVNYYYYSKDIFAECEERGI